MQAIKLSPVTLALLLSLAGPAVSQDLLERARHVRENAGGPVSTETYRSPDRLDLRAGAAFPTGAILADRGTAQIGLDGVFESDFACGRFDMRGSLRNLLSKEMRDEFLDTALGALQSELMYNGLVLACEVSPTACDALKHFRANANALLSISYDRCAAIEEGIRDGLQSARAQAIKDCVERKRQEGVRDPSEALAACEKASEVSGLLGGRVAEFNLARELQKAYHLEGADAARLETLLGSLRITPKGVAGEVKADLVLREYSKLEREYAQAWTEAAQAAAAHPAAPIPSDIEKKLQPPGAPGPLALGLQKIAQLPPAVRKIRIELIASRAAALDLAIKVQELERYLSGAAKLPQNSEARVREIEQELRDLRLQLRHIDELVARKEEYNRTLLASLDHADLHEGSKASAVFAAGRTRESDARFRDTFTGAWGEIPDERARSSRPSSPHRHSSGTAGCGSCHVRRR